MSAKKSGRDEHTQLAGPRDEPQEGETSSPRELPQDTDFRTGLPDPPEEERDPWDAFDSASLREQAEELMEEEPPIDRPPPDFDGETDVSTLVSERPPELPEGVEEPYYEEEYPGESGVAEGPSMVEEAHLVEEAKPGISRGRRRDERHREKRRRPHGQDEIVDETAPGDRHLGRHHKPGHGRGR